MAHKTIQSFYAIDPAHGGESEIIMFLPSVKCPCGFSANTPDASDLYKAHICPKPAPSWPVAAAMIVFILVLGYIAELVVTS